jgi:hypothetical protein
MLGWKDLGFDNGQETVIYVVGVDFASDDFSADFVTSGSDVFINNS